MAEGTKMTWKRVKVRRNQRALDGPTVKEAAIEGSQPVRQRPPVGESQSEKKNWTSARRTRNRSNGRCRE